jgi:hypothetical protein
VWRRRGREGIGVGFLKQKTPCNDRIDSFKLQLNPNKKCNK